MEKPYLIQSLKEISLLGAIKNKIEISSSDLAGRLGNSQQTASRYLLELDKKGLITREFGFKKQLIQITSKGERILQKEYIDYRQIFDLTNQVYFKGKIVSGMGEGSYYTEQEGYIKQFKEKLGFKPFPGTLNVEIDKVERNRLRELRNHEGIMIKKFETDDRTFGGVKCFKAEINEAKGVIVLPSRGHYSNILEFISPVCLRDELGVSDGDQVEINIFFD